MFLLKSNKYALYMCGKRHLVLNGEKKSGKLGQGVYTEVTKGHFEI